MINNAVRGILKRRIAKPGDKKFGQDLLEELREKIKPILKDKYFGGRSTEEFQRVVGKNWKKFYDAIPNSVMVARFKEFTDPVFYDGKPLVDPITRKKVFAKADITKEDFVNYFNDPSVKAGPNSRRRDALVEAMAQEVGFDTANASLLLLLGPALTDGSLK